MSDIHGYTDEELEEDFNAAIESARKIDQAFSELTRLRAQNDELRKALGAVQWNGHDRFRCVECRGQPSSGHAPNCRVGQALATLDVEEKM